MELTQQQDQALAAIRRWLADESWPFFYLAGYAGTGKTTLARYVAELVGQGVEFAAPTGKAAQVLRRKGCATATTVHRLIYLVRDKGRERLEELELKLAEAQAILAQEPLSPTHRGRVAQLEADVADEREAVSKPSFDANPDARLRDAKLLILDECSMVNHWLARDIFDFGVPVLALGDPAQLPPVKGSSYFAEHKPHALLTDIQRQAAESPVLQLATRVRQGLPLERGQYGDSAVIPFSELTAEAALGAGVVLTGHNATRRRFNLRMRSLQGFSGDYPQKGEPLIALVNRHQRGIYNGTLLQAHGDAVEGHDLSLIVSGDDVAQQAITASRVPFDQHRDPKVQDQSRPWERKARVDVDWAYALTVHKSQGSQWDSVVVADDGFARGKTEERRRWLYTAITRAAERVVIAQENS